MRVLFLRGSVKVATKRIDIEDFEREAKIILPKMVYDYYAGGAGQETTISGNLEAFQRLRLVPRVLTGNQDRDMQCKLFGCYSSAPFLIAPSAYHGLAHADGEVATIKAASETEIGMVLAMLANQPIAEVAKATRGCFGLQLSPFKNKKETERLIKEAQQLDFKAIVITVDGQYLGPKKRDIRNQFALPDHLSVPNLKNVCNQEFSNGSQNLFEKNLSWEDIRWIKSISTLPVILKGILHDQDALKALEFGIDGIIVSNHGGRVMDSLIPTLTALPKIVDTVQGKIPVLLDGGIRSGIDIFKALALGADAVLIGRPILWGLAVGGQAGVAQVINLLKKDLDHTMAICGFKSLEEIKAHGKSVLYQDHGL